MSDVSSRADSVALDARELGKTFAGKAVLADIHLSVRRGEIVALLGPSGCGKTTLLRMIAGLLAPDTGSLQLAGTVVASGGGGAIVPPEARGLGMVFQDYALWPHFSVLENVAFPLRMRGIRAPERRERALRALARVNLVHLAERSPGTLSGGQQQRVALARAVVAEPPLVLFDEPLSNLDRELRDSLAQEMAGLLRDLRLTAVYVTHDQVEAFAIADRVAVMWQGGIEQIDSPEQIVRRPATLAVAQFLNLGSLLPGRMVAGRFVGSGFSWPLELPEGWDGKPVRLLIPRNAVRPCPSRANGLVARVQRQQFQGDRYLVEYALGEGAVLGAYHDRPQTLGTEVALIVDHERLVVFLDPAHPVHASIPAARRVVYPQIPCQEIEL
jgi:iron(III) transport system ATP-binding protein